MSYIKLAASFSSSYHRKLSWAACAPHGAGIQEGREIKGAKSTPCGNHSSAAIKLLRYWAVVAAPLCGQSFLGSIDKKPQSQLDFAENSGGIQYKNRNMSSVIQAWKLFWSPCHLVLPTSTVYFIKNQGLE